MNGLEAIELMKQGKMIKNGFYVYRLENEIIQWITEGSLKKGEYWKNEESFDINSKQFEEYNPKPITGWERVNTNNGKYYSITCGYVTFFNDCNETMDIDLLDKANYFSTEEKAEEIDFKQTLFRKLQRFSDENGGNEIYWNGEPQNKYVIIYSHVNRKFMVTSCWQSQMFGQIYFISEEIAEKAIELFRDDLIKYFTGDFGGEA